MLCNTSLCDEIRRVLEFRDQFQLAVNYAAQFPSSEGYHDVQDGEIYRNFVAQHAGNPATWFSLTVSVDGTPVYESSHQSIYPAQVVINELPPEIRYVYKMAGR